MISNLLTPVQIDDAILLGLGFFSYPYEYAEGYVGIGRIAGN